MKNNHLTIVIKNIIILFSLVLNSFLFARADRAGGGGGAFINSDGVLETPIESGLKLSTPQPIVLNERFAPMPKYYSIPSEVSENYDLLMQRIRKIIPSFEILGTFNPLGEKLISYLDKNPEEYESTRIKIMKEYSIVYQRLNQPFDSANFVLTAYTENGITYILPNFEKLDPIKKTKTLIHEANMREAKSEEDRLVTLERVLKIDFLIEQLAYSKPDSELDITVVLQQMAQLKMINENGIFHQILYMMYEELKQDFTVDKFFQDGLSFNSSGMVTSRYEAINPSYIQEVQNTNKLKHNYASMLNGVKVEFESARSYNNEEDKELLKQYCLNDDLNKGIVRVIPDPFILSLKERTKYNYYLDLPIKELVLANCNKTFITNYWHLDTARIVLIESSPFISQIAKGK